MSSGLRALAVGVALALLAAAASVVFQDTAKTDVYVKTGKWSYVIEKAEQQGQCKRGREEGGVEISYTAKEVSVRFYGCNVANVRITIKADSTVPICLTPEGPVEGPQRIPLRPGRTATRTFIFYENGTLRFTVKIGDC